LRASILSTLRAASLLILPFLLLPSCGGPAANDPLGAVIGSLPSGTDVLYVRTLIDENEEAQPVVGVVAVVREAVDRLTLRVYDWDGRTVSLAHSVAGGETFENLDLLDADGDGHRDILVIWGGGQLSMVEVIGRREDEPYRSLFQNAGSEIEVRRTVTGQIEILVTGRTYEELPGQPPVYETIPYRWDGEHFSPTNPDGAT